MKRDINNELKLVLFCAILGAVAGVVFWLFLLLMNRGTWLIWDCIPEKLPGFSWYPVAACTAGGLIIGLFRKSCGDYPEEMTEVFAKLKKNKTYPYRKMTVIVIAALLPLIFGSSVGPEAGMVGIIVALCCWVGDNLKFAGSQSAYYSRVGAAVTLSVMFRSPLFGILDAEEAPEAHDPERGPAGDGAAVITRQTKFILYGVATGAAFGCYGLLNMIFGKVAEGFPSFDVVSAETGDYFLFVLYLACGSALGLFFEYAEKLFGKIGHAMPPVLGEVLAGAVLGAVTCVLPVLRFSGEEQMGVLIREYALYAPLAMIGIAFLKVLLTTMCIRLGLKGGHFFPLIFAAVCLGYGLALLIFPGNAAHATFAAAIVAAGTLGVSMKKPLAVSMLLLLCFPVRALLWILPSATLATLAGKYLRKC